MKGIIFIISGPSGSGKTTLAKALFRSKELRKNFVKSISLTTRPKRTGEKEGKDYFFVSEEEFRQKRKSKKFLEWTRYLGYHYATPKDFVDRQIAQHKNIIFCLDLRGMLKIRRLYPKNTITIFIMPPSLDILHQRVKKRCPKTQKEEIRKRLKFAQQEMLASNRYDYCLVNKDLHETAEKLKDILLRETVS